MKKTRHLCKHPPYKYFREYWKNANWSVVNSSSFLCKRITSAIFKQDGNDHLKELVMFVHNFVNFNGDVSMLGGFILSNLSISFFMSLMLTLEKRNVSFSQLLCIAICSGMDLLCNRIKLTASRNIQEKNIMYLKRNYLEFQRFLTPFLRFRPFHWYWFHPFHLSMICLDVKVLLISKIVCYQLRSLYLSFHSILS